MTIQEKVLKSGDQFYFRTKPLSLAVTHPEAQTTKYKKG
jgi:hypothetical protein